MKSHLLQPESLKNILMHHVPQPEGNYMQSAVMVLLFPGDVELQVLFTQRAFDLKSQPGDICFPGGRKEKNESLLEAALRETWEEIGIPSEEIQILGKPDFLITISGKMVTPFLGYVKSFPFENLIPNPQEVANVFLVPFSYFLDTNPKVSYVEYTPTLAEDFPYELIVGGRNYSWGKTKFPQLFYHYQNFVIWGITARIIHNIKNIISLSSE